MKNKKVLKEKVLSSMKRVVIMLQSVLLLNYPMITRAESESAGGESAGGDLGNTKLVTGIRKLISDATLVLVGLCAAAVVLICIKEGYLYFTGEQEEKPKHMKNIKMTVLIGVLIMCASGLVSVIFGYFA